MAAASALELGGGPGSCPPGPPAGGFSGTPAADCSVLVVVGALRSPAPLERVLQQIESGEFDKVGRHQNRAALRPRCLRREVGAALHSKSSGRTFRNQRGAQRGDWSAEEHVCLKS